MHWGWGCLERALDPDVPAAIGMLSAAVASAASADAAEDTDGTRRVPVHQFNLAVMHLTRLDPPDDAEGLRWLRLSADAGFADAQAYLGEMHETGAVEGVAQDTGEASFWLSLAAGQGHEGAQDRLAALEASRVKAGAP